VLEDGRLGFIDFGIVGRLPPKIFQGVAQLVEGVAAMDYDMMAQVHHTHTSTSHETIT
jgi:predicted unusual protein kinase regulating ubiquinone biosynthesis (AarF/ABC1/UbiB family)